MAKFHQRKVNGKLCPADERAERIIKKLSDDDMVESKTLKGRVYGFHKKYYAMIGIIWANQDKYTVKQHFDNEVKLRAGHCDVYITPEGETRYNVKSISFESMDQIDFEKFYNVVLDQCLEYFIPGLMREEIQQEIELKILDFS